jgi:arsenite methyltransferase
MRDPNTALPPALRRALELLADPPTNPDVSKGYLDLLSTRPVEDAAPPTCGCRASTRPARRITPGL